MKLPGAGKKFTVSTFSNIVGHSFEFPTVNVLTQVRWCRQTIQFLRFSVDSLYTLLRTHTHGRHVLTLQSEGPRLTMSQWVKYWHKRPEQRTPLLNVLSLSLAGTPAQAEVR